MFYERALTEWRDKILKDSGNKNHAFVLRKALCNLKLFPLDVNGFSDLRKIRGIGVDIATRLSSAWKFTCATHFCTESPTIGQIKSLKSGEAFVLVEQSSTENGGRVPLVAGAKQRKAITSQIGQQQKSQTNGKQKGQHFETAPLVRSNSQECVVMHKSESLEVMDFDHLLNVSVSQPAISSFGSENCRPIVAMSPPPTSSSSSSASVLNSLPPSSSSAVPSLSPSNDLDIILLSPSSSVAKPSLLLSHSPEQFAQSHLLLITDNREHIAGARTQRKIKGIGEHLATMGVSFESRPLSVGDYLWLLQWTNWEGKRQELVLDYVVERKTLDDLRRSIKETRYLEQKQRLKKCGLRNVVFVLEGGTTANDRSLEQAMVSSGVESGFLVHRTPNVQGTAKFLQNLTRWLRERCSKQKVTGPPFDLFQQESKKAHAATVSDYWVRQLTVCPGVSTDRARIIRNRFPTFRSFVEFCRENSTDKNSIRDDYSSAIGVELPQLSAAATKNLMTFFRQAMTNE
ncbi:hypothetical protein niasHS_011079 [Heterodera schachtii]|uniref:Crossover junction endonuclease MUS81 n=1 Tax=Heterodera schachtii TaxID=97005 RepID=A0ABD2IVW7_HETSC